MHSIDDTTKKPKLFIPDVSIVIRTYDCVDTIEKWLRDLREVKIRKEILVIDDLSTDGTKELLKQLQPELRLKLILAAKHRGLGLCAKMALAHGKGRYATVLDYTPNLNIDFIPSLLQQIQSDTKLDLVTSQADFIAKLGKLKLAGIEDDDYFKSLKAFANEKDWKISVIPAKAGMTEREDQGRRSL